MKFFNEICQKLIDREPFKFSRWGDGEWACMKGVVGENRDGNTYLPELGEELRKILFSNPPYKLGLQYGVLYNYGLREFVFKHLWELNLDWVNGDILHQALEFGYLSLFVGALKDREVVIVGAKYLDKLPYRHVTTPNTDSFKENDRILLDCLQYAMNPVYLVANAMNSNVIIDRLPDHVTAIDIGSVFDPYLGIPRATYQHKLKADWLW